MSPHERPRERLAALGAGALTDAELIAILLRSGRRGLSAVEMARSLLTAAGSLQQLASASVDELRKTRGIGLDKAVTLQAAFTLAQRMAREIQREAPMLDHPEKVADLLREEARAARVEEFHVLLLNTRRRLIRVERLSQGTLDTVLIHPREVFRPAITANAASDAAACFIENVRPSRFSRNANGLAGSVCALAMRALKRKSKSAGACTRGCALNSERNELV